MSKHTPGPWEQDVENEEDAVRRFVVNARQIQYGGMANSGYDRRR